MLKNVTTYKKCKYKSFIDLIFMINLQVNRQIISRIIDKHDHNFDYLSIISK